MNALTQKALQIGLSPAGIASVRTDAKKVLPTFPHSGCATFLSVLLRHAGFDLPPITWAEDLADRLKADGWQVISRRQAKAGDVGVSIDGNGNKAADHIWLTLSVTGDQMVVADNQSSAPHNRTISGRDGKTPTDYFLRAPSEEAGTTVTLNGKLLPPDMVKFISNQTYISVHAVEFAEVGTVERSGERVSVVVLKSPVGN